MPQNVSFPALFVHILFTRGRIRSSREGLSRSKRPGAKGSDPLAEPLCTGKTEGGAGLAESIKKASKIMKKQSSSTTAAKAALKEKGGLPKVRFLEVDNLIGAVTERGENLAAMISALKCGAWGEEFSDENWVRVFGALGQLVDDLNAQVKRAGVALREGGVGKPAAVDA